MIFSFANVYCGVIDGDGCGHLLPEMHAEFSGIAMKNGLLVKVYDVIGMPVCPNCGRLSRNVFTATDWNNIENIFEKEKSLLIK